MVHLHHRGTGAAAGHSGLILTVTNVSTSPCSVSGFLRVGLLSSHDVRYARARPTRSGYLYGVHSSGPLAVVVLASGATASALLEGDWVGDGTRCRQGWGISVRLPVVSTLVRMHFGTSFCPSAEIHPLVAGTTGRPA
jgi:hypothetical protein